MPCDTKKENKLPLKSRLAKQVLTWPFGTTFVRWARYFAGEGRPHEQWQRIVMNRVLQQWINELNPQNLDTLEVSGANWPKNNYFRSHTSVDFPEFDICNQVHEKRYDLIIAEQVFEHLLWPYRAGRNVYEMLKPGGWFLMATPFLIRIHECPNDCTRWTPTGIRYFLAECGFPLDRIRVESWGNKNCVIGNLERWPVYLPWRDSLKNDSRYPVQVWALARKEV